MYLWSLPSLCQNEVYDCLLLHTRHRNETESGNRRSNMERPQRLGPSAHTTRHVIQSAYARENDSAFTGTPSTRAQALRCKTVGFCFRDFACMHLLSMLVYFSISMISSAVRTFAKPFLNTFNSGSCISGSSVDVTSLPNTTLKLLS